MKPTLRTKLRTLLAVAAILLAAPRLLATPPALTDHPVNDDASLRAAILAAADGDTVTFTGDITLTADLPAVQSNITIVGGGHTLSGNDQFRAFFIGAWTPGTATQVAVTVTIQDLIIDNAKARGGNGGWADAEGSGGGGAGLGGAIFVANLAHLTIENVALQNNTAQGGAGGVFSGQPGIAAAGGGMGGDGGHATALFAGSGAGGGGGLGRSATGGRGNTGGAGSPGIATGAAPGGNASSGNFGGVGGGGGGSGTGSGVNAAGGGGIGGTNGAGGSTGGNGGFGGGGGGQGGDGGYGGGGGGGGGNGGFGGGGGAGAGGTTGGFAGGAGGPTTAGGGAALGGALFVQAGGTLTIEGNLTIDGNTLLAGPAVLDGVDGSTFGSGLFVAGDGTLTFNPAAGETQTVNNDIADQSGSGGMGADAGTMDLRKIGAGTLDLRGANTYAGRTFIEEGTVIVGGVIGGVGARVWSGAMLGGSGSLSGLVQVDANGVLRPDGVLHTGALILGPDARLAIDVLGPAPGTGYDQVVATGTVDVSGAALVLTLGYAPTAGDVMTIIANDGSDGVTGEFSALPNGTTFVLNGRHLRIDYGNDVTLTVLQETPVVSAAASAGVTFGGSIHDTATVAGGFSPTGTVTFRAYGPGDATCAGAPVFTTTTPLSAGTATSASFTPAAAGVYRWIASYSGDANNAPAATACGNTNQTVTIAKAGQTIAFTLPASKLVDDPSFPIAAESDSHLDVTLILQTPAVCTIAGGMLTLVSVGTCTIAASQSGDGNYTAATPVTRNLTVAPNCAIRSLQPAELLTALGGLPYAHTFSVANGAAPASFTLDGALPPGLSFSNGVISGTPSARGAFPITVGATDAQACHVSASFTLAVSAERRVVAGAGSGAAARAFTLAGRTPVAQFEAFGPVFPGGASVAQGDTNGDGTPDVIAGAGPGGGPAVRVFDGRSNAQIASFFAFEEAYRGGVEVAAGDITGDGIPEVLAVPAGCGGELVVRAFNAHTGAFVREYPVSAPWSCGLHVAAGDVNGDGLADIVVGAGYLGAPLVTVLDGYAGGTLRQFPAYVDGFLGGVYVAAGDITGDGFADIVTGAGAGGGPHVRAFNGITGAEIAGPLGSFFAYHPAFPGGVRVAAGDLDGDGRADLITAAGPGGGPHVRVFSGATGAELLGLFAFDPAFLGGAFVAAPPATGRMEVDVASASGGAVHVAGWALKQLDIDTAGTDAIHVWALPVGGGAPVFVGAASSRLARPDVAIAFGGEFLRSGFDITGTLAPGVYDLAVFARNRRTLIFDQMRIVRVTVN